MSRRLYVFKSGRLSRKQNTLFILGEKDTKKYIPVENVSEIHIFGSVDFNKDALEFLSENGIVLHIYNYYGYYMGSFYPREHLVSGYLTLQQATHYTNEEKRLVIAKKFVVGAIKNMMVVLKYYERRGKQVKTVVEKLEELLLNIDKSKDVNSLMGLEGNSRDIYYSAFDKIIENDSFKFQTRSRRPPQNELNALISFGNTMLYTSILSEIYRTHLNPSIGYLHSTNFRRFSLNLDVSEIFKPIIVDRIIFSLLNKKSILKNDFSPHLNGVYLSERGKKKFVEEMEKQLITTIKHPKIKRRVSYKYLMRLELYKIEKHLIGDETYEPYVSTW